MQDLLTPQNCALVLLDQQAGLQFGVQSMERQTLLNNSVALMETALVEKNGGGYGVGLRYARQMLTPQ